MVVFRRDPCGILCMLLTYLAVLYADYVVVFQLIKPTFPNSLWGSLHVLLFNLSVFLLILSHLRAVLSDPGLVPIPENVVDFSRRSDSSTDKDNQRSRPDGWSVCIKCAMYRPPRAHHCRTCRRCVRRMDHHCPWINNCVGELNQRYFIQFLVYVGVCSLYSISLVVITWVIDPHSKLHGHKESRLVHSIALVIESVLFGLFVLAIFCDQIQGIMGDETAVEYVKGRASHIRRNLPKMLLLKEVFGTAPLYAWLCPCQTSNIVSYFEDEDDKFCDRVTV